MLRPRRENVMRRLRCVRSTHLWGVMSFLSAGKTRTFYLAFADLFACFVPSEGFRNWVKCHVGSLDEGRRYREFRAECECTNCNEPVLQPEQSLQFFSDYSRCYECQKCKTFDYHFAKPLSVAFAPKKPTPPQIKAIIHQHSVNAKSASASPPPPSPAPVTPAAMPWLPPQLAAFYHAAPQDLYFLHHQMAPPVRRYHTGFMGDVQHHVSPLAIVAES
ncbi:unnamed protein product [Notodromas monacha]|uniref:Headcase middle domain-containing protein n=1 Tax=Notodromas monacha TaxID=399045 RepID=A0A7R9BTN3_9CRUS|nr:unnamed protein product [Notodromas monacha]CAG0921222.1 unnamed protein product [Notodromas monacha]